jgi:hypothetical protein
MLKEQMKNVRDDLVKVEKNTVNESMKLLLDLDIMRTNMINVQMALQVQKKFFYHIRSRIDLNNNESFIFFVLKKEADNW